jgi:hypothetical protein
MTPDSARDFEGPERQEELALTDGGERHLDDYSDEELGQYVRQTAAFRAAVACREFAGAAEELRTNDTLAWDRLIRETHERQGTSVSKRDTTRSIITEFLSVIGDHAELASHPADVAREAAGEATDD